MAREYVRLRKRIMLNLDGTGQAAYSGTAAPVSNVARIGRATLLEDVEHSFEQIVYYQSGVGSGAETGVIQGLRESGLGVGLVSNVREAYGFLCNNYDFHDEIYITGFSRGAFTARSVAGLIGKVGILTKRGLEQFHEAFDFYEHFETWIKEGKECPVTEEAGTTRRLLPDGNEITIRAVGVWDTVGALSGDHTFHDVTLGKHIENGFHMLSLNEKRGPFEPTLWEVYGKPRRIENFEQCWMPGDHSNVGGSWDEQQLADISLAWMMSRFGSLGVKFDQAYLYREFVKFKDYVKDYVKRYPQDLYPRHWGEGRSKDLCTWMYGWGKTRTPTMYYRPEKTSSWLPWKGSGFAPSSNLLENTNETFHPSVRYRHYCSRQGILGAEGQGPWETKSIDGWTWPAKAEKPSASADGLTYLRSKGKGTVTVKESDMGYYERLLLAIYDQDPALREQYGSKGKEYSIWEEVLGGKPDETLIQTVSKIKKENPKDSP